MVTHVTFVSVVGGVMLASLSHPVWASRADPDSDPGSASQYEAAEPDAERIRVTGQGNQRNGAFVSSSQGWVSSEALIERPMLRTGEMLEFIPGMMVTQHSGSGKANQYFLRGFNLDHGTDFAVEVDGMPVNMRSHGHGQGYSDLNFVIPETVDNLSYFKGTYYAGIGDFSGAGGAQFQLKDSLDTHLASVTLGEDNYQRLLLLNHVGIGQATLYSAFEYQSYDGPWTDISEGINRKNALVRLATPWLNGTLTLTGMAYDNSWNGADQIPQRAVSQGIIDRLGSIDTHVGGAASRYSVSAVYTQQTLRATLYAIDTSLSLFSNFTYLLDNPQAGDEFEQLDDRQIYGGDIANTFSLSQASDNTLTLGAQWRYDDISEVGLFPTVNRQRTGVTRQDSVSSFSYALYGQTNWYLSERLNVTLGGRYDRLDVDVDSIIPANSGTKDDDLFSLKGAVKYALSDTLTTFINYGQGYHSNDARGAVLQVDPVNNEAASAGPLLVRSTGAETGITWTDNRLYNVSAAIWTLSLDSELVYVGDAGFTEASRPSKRYGVEMSAYYWLSHHLNADIEAAWSHARFSDTQAGEGDFIEGTVPVVVSAGTTWYQQSNQQGFSATLRARYLSSRVVDSSDTVSPPSTFLINTQLAYAVDQWKISLEVLNAFDSEAHDIDYYYTSRLPGEPAAGQDDLHYHPVEPRTARLTVSLTY